MAAKVIASTSGMVSATTMPDCRPSEKKLTSSTMPTASASVSTNSATESRTAEGWSETCSRRMPTGSVFCRRANSTRSALPSAMMSPPGFIDTAMPMPSRPMKRMRGAAGSEKPRCTVATSPRRKVRPLARIGKSRISSTVAKPPLTRSCTRSLPVSKNPVGVTAFCASIACCTASSGTPRVASLVLDSSMKIFSSCTPSRSTLATSGTRCRSSSMRSA